MSKDRAQLLSNSIANKMKRKIIDGEWLVGEQLPNEQTLAERLKVSRTTIREAVKILASKNILCIKRGKGTFVEHTPGVVDDPLGLEFLREETMIRHLCEYRLTVEPQACHMAAERASDKQLKEMSRIFTAMENIEGKYSRAAPENRERVLDRFVDLDAEFHSLLYQMTQNTVFLRLSPIINNTIIENYTTELYRRRGQKLMFSYAHRVLFEAIEKRDPKLAQTLAQEQMQIMQEELCAEIARSAKITSLDGVR